MLVGGTVAAQAPARPLGLIVVWDGLGREIRNYKVHEVRSHSAVGQEFSATTVGGQRLGGHASHCPVFVSYQWPLPRKLVEFRKAIDRFPITKPYLEKLIPGIEKEVEHLKQLEAAAAKKAAESGMTLDAPPGDTLYNVIPIKLRKDGKIVFQHSKGVFPDPVSYYRRKDLADFAKANPKLGFEPAFQEVMATFVPVVPAGGRVLQSARLVEQADDELVILHDGGLERLDRGKFSDASLERLVRSGEKWHTLAAKFEVGAEAMAKEQQILVASISASGASPAGGGFSFRRVGVAAVAGAAGAYVESKLRGETDEEAAAAAGAAAVGEGVRDGVQQVGEQIQPE